MEKTLGAIGCAIVLVIGIVALAKKDKKNGGDKR